MTVMFIHFHAKTYEQAVCVCFMLISLSELILKLLTDRSWGERPYWLFSYVVQ